MIAAIAVPLTTFLTCVVVALVVGAIFGWISSRKDSQ